MEARCLCPYTYQWTMIPGRPSRPSRFVSSTIRWLVIGGYALRTRAPLLPIQGPVYRISLPPTGPGPAGKGCPGAKAPSPPLHSWIQWIATSIALRYVHASLDNLKIASPAGFLKQRVPVSRPHPSAQSHVRTADRPRPLQARAMVGLYPEPTPSSLNHWSYPSKLA